ncbi:hypothetical protein [Brucella pseudogrignonensis]|uniref:Uncharacterized protein n=1 Tax=Brucella pseudogrignonensis TaxID=419475 RepID=A0A256GHA6_9HYPH|nr:hypothetical protein [Brucella pseudogrignonensis]OYR26535.1 hypothetical protein CEV34_2246 [Brucella pseudogrignonensis]
MTHATQTSFTPIGQILAAQVLPHLRLAQKLPLRISCNGTASYGGADEPVQFDQTIALGERASSEEAMAFASLRVSRSDIRIGADEMLRFQPRVITLQDRDHGLVLGGIVRAGIILWQQPVASDGEARRIVTEASRLRGMAFAAAGRGDDVQARDLRFQACHLEARLADPFWRASSAELLRMPQAA